MKYRILTTGIVVGWLGGFGVNYWLLASENKLNKGYPAELWVGSFLLFFVSLIIAVGLARTMAATTSMRELDHGTIGWTFLRHAALPCTLVVGSALATLQAGLALELWTKETFVPGVTAVSILVAYAVIHRNTDADQLQRIGQRYDSDGDNDLEDPDLARHRLEDQLLSEDSEDSRELLKLLRDQANQRGS